MIVSAKYIRPHPSTDAEVTMADGSVWVTDTSLPPDTEHRRAVHQWLNAGGVVSAYEPPAPTQADYSRAIEAHLDAVVGERGYSSVLSAASYSGDPVYGAEGDAAKAWRSAVWSYAYTELAKVQAGQRIQPTPAELIAELPRIEWPK